MALLDRRSPVTVTISRVRSPTSGRHTKKDTPSIKENGARSSSPLVEQLCVPRRPHSARQIDRQEPELTSGCSLLVPDRGRSGTMGDYSNRTIQNRSRSYSPFNGNARPIPCGSPTFRRVMKDMLSDSDLSMDGSDVECDSVKAGKPRKVGRGNKTDMCSQLEKSSMSDKRSTRQEHQLKAQLPVGSEAFRQVLAEMKEDDLQQKSCRDDVLGGQCSEICAINCENNVSGASDTMYNSCKRFPWICMETYHALGHHNLGHLCERS